MQFALSNFLDTREAAEDNTTPAFDAVENDELNTIWQILRQRHWTE